MGQLDHQLVDSPPATPLENVDANQVPPYGADAAGHGAKRSRPVRHPDPKDVRGHAATVALPM